MQIFDTYLPLWSIALIIIFVVGIVYSTIRTAREQREKNKIISLSQLMWLFGVSIEWKLQFFKEDTNFILYSPTHNPFQTYSVVRKNGKNIERINFNATQADKGVDIMKNIYMGVDNDKIKNKIENDETQKQMEKRGNYIEYHFPKGNESQKYLDDLKTEGFWKIENPNFNEILIEKEIGEKMELYCLFKIYVLYKEYEEDDIIYACFILFADKTAN